MTPTRPRKFPLGWLYSLSSTWKAFWRLLTVPETKTVRRASSVPVSCTFRLNSWANFLIFSTSAGSAPYAFSKSVRDRCLKPGFARALFNSWRFASDLERIRMEISTVWSGCELWIRRAPRTALRSLPASTLNFPAEVTTAPSFGGTERLGTNCDWESHRGEVQGRPAVQMESETA